MSRIQNITGIILKKRPFLNSDLVLTLLDTGGQRMDLIVKGAASGHSKRAAHLEIMNEIQATVYQSKSHAYLQNPHCLKSFSLLKRDLSSILGAQLLLEIIEKMVLEKDPHPEIYALLHETLEHLNSQTAHPFTTEVAMIKLAHHLGFLPNFKECNRCRKALQEELAHWDPATSSLLCPECKETHNPLPLKYRKALEFFRKADQSEWKKLHLEAEERSELQLVLSPLFTKHMDKPLSSLALAFT